MTPTHPNLFDAAASEAARNQGHALVLMNEDDRIREALYEALLEAAHRAEEISADDLWAVARERQLQKPHHPNVFGALWRRAALAGVIEPTGRIAKTTRTAGHRRNVSIWKSCVYQGAP